MQNSLQRPSITQNIRVEHNPFGKSVNKSDKSKLLCKKVQIALLVNKARNAINPNKQPNLNNTLLLQPPLIIPLPPHLESLLSLLLLQNPNPFQPLRYLLLVQGLCEVCS